MREIPLVGKYTHLLVLVDDEDYASVAALRWTHHKHGRTSYAIHRWVEGGRERRVRIHTLLTGWPLVDHVNGNGLDNRRHNLRLATSSGNAQNSRKPATYAGRSTLSRFKGVSFKPLNSRRPWQAYITVSRERMYLGSFTEEVLAAEAYDHAARLHHGEYAKLNFSDTAYGALA